MRTESFTTFAQNFAKAFGQSGVSVSFGGTEAMTDGRHIRLPALPAGSVMTPWQVKVYNGYLDHEVAHVKYTNFKNFRIDRRKDPLKFTLFNLFEDVRIENNMVVDYPGTKPHLEACTQQIEYDLVEKHKDDTQTAAQGMLNAIYQHAYKDYRDSECSFPFRSDIRNYPQLRPVMDAMKEIPRLRSEIDAQKLADKVLDLLPGEVDWSAPSPQQGQGEDEPMFFMLVPGAGGGRSLPPNAIPINDKALIQAAEEFLRENDRKTLMEEMNKDVTEDQEPTVKTVPSHGKYDSGSMILPPVGTDQDRIFVPARKDRRQYARVMGDAADEIMATKRMLQIYLQTRTAKAWSRGLEEGRLDEEALAELKAGSKALYKDRRERTLIDTDIQLVIDLSGSMNEKQTQLAAVVLIEALIGVPKVKLSIAGFTTNDAYYTGTTGGRQNGMDMLLFKDFNEDAESARARVGSLDTSGYTPLGEAYAYGFERLVARKATKRILWVITDGRPEFDKKDRRHDENLLMKRIHKRCKRNKIKVVGMAIGGGVGNEFRANCDAYESIRSGKDLPEAVLSIIKGIL